MANMIVAETILKQLGGNRFCVMTGAKNFVGGKDSLMFSIGSNSKKINKVRITLNAMDTYDIEFMKYSPRTLEVTMISKAEGIYDDMLQEVFTNHTGLYTKL